MDDSQALARAVCERLLRPNGDGPLLLLAPPQLLGELLRALGDGSRLTVAASPKRLGTRQRRELVADHPHPLRCSASHLPVADGSFAAATAVCLLTRMTDAGEALGAIKRALRPGGRLVLADRTSWNRTLRVLTGTRQAPEDLTRMLLNAGFVDIRQSWTRPHRGAVITSAFLHNAIP